MTRMTAATAVLAGTALALTGLTGCGGEEAPPAAGPTATVTVTANPETSPETSPRTSPQTSPETSPATPQTPAETQSPATGEVDLFTYLKGHPGYRDASGSAEYDQDREGRQLEIHATKLQTLAGQSVTVYVQRTKVGTMQVSSAGAAHREWETEHGDQVPTVAVDDRVHILADSGDVVLSGRLKTDFSD